MRPIGHIIHGPRNSEPAEFAAAFVVGATNEVILHYANIGTNDARTISFQRGTIMIGVSHGAIAGIIHQKAGELMIEINKKLKTAGNPQTQVKKIITRLQPPRTP